MKNRNKLYIRILAVIILFVNIACQSVDFENTNIDPNEPTANVTSALLTEAQRALGFKSTAVTPALYIQHIAEVQFTDASRYGTTEFDYGFLYTQYLNNLETIIRLNSNPETAEDVATYGANENQIAVAKILKAHIFQYITDRWGNVPFSEALQRELTETPKFDSQEFIYGECFRLIEEGLAGIDTNVNGPEGDILLNGDMNRWRQYANTLKMIMALRVSDIQPDVARAKFIEAMNSGTISSAAENIFFPFTTDDATDNPWEDAYNGSRAPDYAVSNTFIDFLQDSNRNDPRLFKYADPIGNDDTGTIYVGMEYGLSNPATDRGTVSFITSDIANRTDAPGVIFTYAQVAFSKAEAVLKGWIPGDAETYYYEGIKASMNQWFVTQAEYDVYITQPAVLYDATRAIELIAEQKWVAAYMQPYEAWAEWRRLDYPSFTPAAEPLNGTGIPVRQGYTSLLFDTNGASLNQAVSDQNLPTFDNLNTKLWWDRN